MEKYSAIIVSNNVDMYSSKRTGVLSEICVNASIKVKEKMEMMDIVS
jgi:hypothetical protein